MVKNYALTVAKNAKKDEFYTQLADIEKELNFYNAVFSEKTVFCNCDNPFKSNFFKYFAKNFNRLGLKKLIATNYCDCDANEQLSFFSYEQQTSGEPASVKPLSLSELPQKSGGLRACKIEITEVNDCDGEPTAQALLKNKKNTFAFLNGDGDFRSSECIELLKQADIVVTNPLFREYLTQLIEYDKKFIIIGNQNAVTYKEIFPLIKSNKLFLGLTMDGSNRYFEVPSDYQLTKSRDKIKNGKKYAFVKGVAWFTNFNVCPLRKKIIPYKAYNASDYPKYDNYDAIEVGKVADIPKDYFGVMGVPVTFLHKYNPEEYEIIGHEHDLNGNGGAGVKHGQFELRGKGVYKRILIRKKRI